MSKTMTLLATPLMVAALSIATMPASAQNIGQGGLVNVAVNDVNLLNDLNLNAPITVQVPIGIAANVCNVGANVLAAAIRQDGEADCEAQTTSEAFNRQVARQTQ